MAYVILGLLLIRPMSLYDIIRAFEAGPSLFYSTSSGSIKRAIDGLLRDGNIEVEKIEATGRGRKTYQITPAGREYFRSWMLSDIVGANAVSTAFARLFFLGFIERQDREQVLDAIESTLEHAVRQLKQIEAEIVQSDLPTHLSDVATYQRATLAFGLASRQFALEWFRHNLR